MKNTIVKGLLCLVMFSPLALLLGGCSTPAKYKAKAEDKAKFEAKKSENVWKIDRGEEIRKLQAAGVAKDLRIRKLNKKIWNLKITKAAAHKAKNRERARVRDCAATLRACNEEIQDLITPK